MADDQIYHSVKYMLYRALIAILINICYPYSNNAFGDMCRLHYYWSEVTVQVCVKKPLYFYGYFWEAKISISTNWNFFKPNIFLLNHHLKL